MARTEVRSVESPRWDAWLQGLGCLVFPSPCFLCGVSLEAPLRAPICSGCESRLGRAGRVVGRCGRAHSSTSFDTCDACRRSRLVFEKCLSLGVYDHALERAVTGLKFSSRPAIAHSLGRSLARCGRRFGFFSDEPVLVPVPLSSRRRRRRGYNQAERIARVIAADLGLPLSDRWLFRSRHTPPQTELSARERVKSVRDAFTCVADDEMRGRRVILVDDVVTTGATASACSAALMAAGAGKVDVATAARVV